MPMRRPASSCVRPSLRTARVISITRPDLILSFSASAKPRSANMLPEPVSIPTPLMTRFAMFHLLGQCLGNLQPGANELQVLLRRGDSALALFLEAVEDKYGFLEFDGVDRSVGPACGILNNFQHAGAAKS